MKKGTPLWKALLLEHRLPWRYKNALEKTQLYFSWKVHNIVSGFYHLRKKRKILICSRIKVNGGSTISLSLLANELSKKFNVIIKADRDSAFIKNVNFNIKLTTQLLDSDFYIYHTRILDNLAKEANSLIKAGKKVIFSIHELDIKSKKLLEIFSKAYLVRFVGNYQKNFIRYHKKNGVVIPNTVGKIRKRKKTSNIGFLGRLYVRSKNMQAVVRIFNLSESRELYLWGGTEKIQKKYQRNKNIKIMSWERNQNKVYDSFNILTNMSKYDETFSRTVVEAMSIGMPCILSNIPAHKAFKDCPGIILINPKNYKESVKKVNYLLKNEEQLKPKIVDYFKKHYSKEDIMKKWFKILEVK